MGIAEAQTGMSPDDSPGGWQIIGRTPLKLFAPKWANPFSTKQGTASALCPSRAMTTNESVQRRAPDGRLPRDLAGFLHDGPGPGPLQLHRPRGTPIGSAYLSAYDIADLLVGNPAGSAVLKPP